MSCKSRTRFSIIVPIYNVEKYLDKCIQSVLEQSFASYELILVDDGSPDMCGKICDKYASKNGQVNVLHKKNGGLSSARNAGIDTANGEYVIFLDSDDFWDDKDALKNIDTQLNESNADVLIFPAKRYYEDKGEITYILNKEVDRNQVIQKDTDAAICYMIKENVYRAAAWNKVIRKSIIDEYQMRFKEGYLSEDMDWCGNLLLYAKQFDFYSNPFYAYRQQRAGSITKCKTEKLIADKIYMCETGLQQAKTYPDKNRGVLLASYYAYEYAVMLGVSSGLIDRKTLKRMKNLQELLDYDCSDKVKKVNKLKHLIGYSLTRKALCFFVRNKR